ncbi:hypothetical protein [Trueperella pecoris]|nr:hypothetical protein [Trueperella pecoris]
MTECSRPYEFVAVGGVAMADAIGLPVFIDAKLLPAWNHER